MTETYGCNKVKKNSAMQNKRLIPQVVDEVEVTNSAEEK